MDAIMKKGSSRKNTSTLADHSEFSIIHIFGVNISATIFIQKKEFR